MAKFRMRANFAKKCKWCKKQFVPNWSHVRHAWSEYCCKRCGQVGHYESHKQLVHPPFTQNALDELKALWDGGATCKELMERFRVGGKYIRRELRRSGVDAKDFRPRGARGRRPTNARSYRFDAFSKRDAETAYWAGFLMADGSVSDSGELSLSVHEQDRSHVILFAKWIGLSATDVYRAKPSGGSGAKAKIHLKHQSLVGDLRTWGVVPRKTYCFIEPDVPCDLLPHFVRGWVDGDGYIMTAKTKERSRVVGNRMAMRWLASRVAECTSGIVIPRVGSEKDGRAWATAAVSGPNNLLRFLSWMYDGTGPRLSRKWTPAIAWSAARSAMLRKCKDRRVVGNTEFDGRQVRPHRLHTTTGRAKRSRSRAVMA